MFELPPPVLSVTGLSHRYAGRAVLHDCALSLYPGECLAIVGASGSGKSSLLSLLAGRQAWQEIGHYHLAGRDMRAQAAPRFVREVSGYVAQQAGQMLNMNLSAAANIVARPLDLGRRDARALLAEALDWLEKLGLDPARLGDRVGGFSGGMQQRVQIAAALIHRPQILFLDEPTTGLDTVAQSGLIDILRGFKQAQATAMLFVTHDLAVARLLADRVLVIEAGRIVEEAVCDCLLAAPQSAAGRALVRAML